MAKHIYDSDGNYKGKILSDKEHRRNKRRENGGGGPVFLGICLLGLIVGSFAMSWKFGLGLTVWLTIVACYHFFLSKKLNVWWGGVDRKKKDMIIKLGVILVIIILILLSIEKGLY